MGRVAEAELKLVRFHFDNRMRVPGAEQAVTARGQEK